MTHVLLGGSGVLGSGFRAVLSAQGAAVQSLSPDWTSPDAVRREIGARLPLLLRRAEPTTVVWAAGVGHVGATPHMLAAETAGVSALADAVRALPPASAARTTVVFASSAGALFAGHGSGEVTDGTPPCPTSTYGREKLRQEQVLRAAADDSGCRVLACRMTNLYGLAGGHLTPRGLVSTAVRCTRLRQPMTVFVSSDTRRDYLFNRDAAALALEAAQQAPAGFSVDLLRDGRTRTVAEVLALVGDVAGRRVPATYAERPATRLQPRVLRFARPQPSRVRRIPMETGLALMVRAPLAA